MNVNLRRRRVFAGVLLVLLFPAVTAWAAPAETASERAFRSFDRWLQSYLSTTSAASTTAAPESSVATAEAVSLAKQRRQALKELARTDPRDALARALPPSVIKRLPARHPARGRELRRRLRDRPRREHCRRLQQGRHARIAGEPHAHRRHAHVRGAGVRETPGDSVQGHPRQRHRHRRPGRPLRKPDASAGLRGGGRRSHRARALRRSRSLLHRREGGRADPRLRRRGVPEASSVRPGERRSQAGTAPPGGSRRGPRSPRGSDRRDLGLDHRREDRPLHPRGLLRPARRSRDRRPPFRSTMDVAVNTYYQDISYDKTSLRTTVIPTVRLPRTAAEYQTIGDGQILTDAQAAARAAGFDPATFNLFIVAFPQMSFGYSGKARVGRAGVWLNGSFGVGRHRPRAGPQLRRAPREPVADHGRQRDRCRRQRGVRQRLRRDGTRRDTRPLQRLVQDPAGLAADRRLHARSRRAAPTPSSPSTIPPRPASARCGS